MRAAITKSRIRSYFEKYPGKLIGIHTLYQHFSDVTTFNLGYHLKNLTDEGFLIKPKRGLYGKNSAYQSPEEKRLIVEEHLRVHGSPVVTGQDWKPGEPALKASVNPALLPHIARMFGDSIIQRMKGANFALADVRFVEALLSRVYPLSEQQKNVCDRLIEGLPSPNGQSNGVAHASV